jgi:hypothetical protein
VTKKRKKSKKPKKRFSSDGKLMVCPTCKGEGERLFPDPPDEPVDVTEYKHRLPGGAIVICPRCRGIGTVWNYPK